MRIHLGKKNHKCPHCEYKSVRKDNLKSHMKTHYKNNKEFKTQLNKQERENPAWFRHNFKPEVTMVSNCLPNEPINDLVLSHVTTVKNNGAFNYQSKSFNSLHYGFHRNQLTLDPIVSSTNYLPGKHL